MQIRKRALLTGAALVLPALLAAAPIADVKRGDLDNPEGKSIGLLEFQESEISRLSPLSNDIPDHYPPADLDPPVDITHYRIEIDVDEVAKTFAGWVTIDGEVRRDGVDSLRLNFCGPPISTVLIGSDLADYTWENGKLNVKLSPVLPAHGTFSITVVYSGFVDRGLNFPSASPGSTTAIYTFSEPEIARYWYPCLDVPNDKVTADVIVTVPDDYKVGSNGRLVEETSLNGRRRFHWSVTEPIATYLLCFAAAPYTILTDNTLSGLPIVHYVYPEDAAAGTEAFAHIPEMIQYFSALFGPYPFEKYGHAEAFFPGGMEHQSLTLIAEFVVRNGATNQWILAHELAHQWWGDALTPKDWRHIWLNEGFASYGDALWAEHLAGAEGLKARMGDFQYVFKLGFLDRGLAEPVLDPPGSRLFGFTVYDKGAWVLHALRHIVGDEAFFNILRSYHAAHRFGNVDTDDFIAACEAVHGSDLNWFFDPWLMETGLPRYSLSWSQTPILGDWMRVAVTVRQTQASPVYAMPVDFAFRTDRGETRLTEFIDHTPQTFEVTVRGALPDSGVVLDPDEWILKTVDLEPQTPVRLSAFSAARSDGGAVIRWTVDESAAGYVFMILRQAPGGDRVPILDQLLGGQLDYEIVDAAAPDGVVDYWLRAQNRAGEVDWYGPMRLQEASEPPGFTLMPNVPNPFRASTNIAYRLRTPGPVRLLIFDAGGRAVARLVDRIEAAGSHSAVWDGRTDSGLPAGPGVYFVRLEAGGEAVTRKAVLRNR